MNDEFANLMELTLDFDLEISTVRGYGHRYKTVVFPFRQSVLTDRTFPNLHIISTQTEKRKRENTFDDFLAK